VVDDQEAVEVPIVQGEHKMARDNTPLGLVAVEELPEGPAFSPVDVEFQLDISGVLHVSATHVPSGKQARIRIADTPHRLSKRERKAALQKVELLSNPGEQLPLAAESGRDDAETILARALLERAATVLANKASSATQSALEHVQKAQLKLRAALAEATESHALAALSDELSDALLDLT
jgi:molecular chaperone DnaK (HSP70)